MAQPACLASWERAFHVRAEHDQKVRNSRSALPAVLLPVKAPLEHSDAHKRRVSHACNSMAAASSAAEMPRAQRPEESCASCG